MAYAVVKDDTSTGLSISTYVLTCLSLINYLVPVVQDKRAEEEEIEEGGTRPTT